MATYPNATLTEFFVFEYFISYQNMYVYKIYKKYKIYTQDVLRMTFKGPIE